MKGDAHPKNPKNYTKVASPKSVNWHWFFLFFFGFFFGIFGFFGIGFGQNSKLETVFFCFFGFFGSFWFFWLWPTFEIGNWYLGFFVFFGFFFSFFGVSTPPHVHFKIVWSHTQSTVSNNIFGKFEL